MPVVADFEAGIPPGFVGFADSWDGSGSATTLAYETTMVDLPVDGKPTTFDLTEDIKAACGILIDPIVDGLRQLTRPGLWARSEVTE